MATGNLKARVIENVGISVSDLILLDRMQRSIMGGAGEIKCYEAIFLPQAKQCHDLVF